MQKTTRIETDKKTGDQVLVLVPANDRAARIAMIAYANSVQEINPLLAEHLSEWVIDLNLGLPMPAPSKKGEPLPDWLVDQSKIRIDGTDDEE